MRQTLQRAAIREALAGAGRPLRPHEVLQAARRRAPRLGIATVYRNLRRLVAEGWLTAVEVPGEASRFEPVGLGHHHHFHCRGCGRTFDLAGCSEDCQTLGPRGFRVESHELFLFGRCASCAG